MKKAFPYSALLFLIGLVFLLDLPCKEPQLAAGDYTFMWWAHGWRGRSPHDEKVLCIQTGHYGMAIDVEKVALLNLGPISNAMSYSDASQQGNEVIFNLPSPDLTLIVSVDGEDFHCVRGTVDQSDRLDFPVRIIDSGRYVQRADILQLTFKNKSGEQLEAEGRLEITALPERLSFLFELSPKVEIANARLSIEVSGHNCPTDKMKEPQNLEPGRTYSEFFVWTPEPDDIERFSGAEISVSNLNKENETLPIQYDAIRGWCHISLPFEAWQIGDEPDHLDRFTVTINNPTGQMKVCPLLFALDERVWNITGMSPMMRDRDGNPLGIPVQISKNWHSQKDRPLLYDGPWFHGFTLIRVPPHEEWCGEFDLAYARWGGVPAASHAQLCLIGWGVNQLWDQVAIGSWGESICYDPDVNLNRSMIDDVRPLMVSGMGDNPRQKWSWTNNVGGGDFLVYFDERNEKQFLTRMRTAYLRCGPNLTEVIYSGVTADGAIQAQIAVSTPRCDDINRAYHHIRYDVLKPVPFERLAFYQLGADNYNDHQFTTMARGNADGLKEEWNVQQGGKRYHKQGLLCDGVAPWFSLHDAISRARGQGAWANRGMVVRSWKARLGRKDIPVPYASVFGTENGPPSANVELSPPPELNRLEPGDFVEADIELLVMPISADDYYGPNEPLRRHLAEYGNTWQPVHRQAAGNQLKLVVDRGRLVRGYPVVIEVGANGDAELQIEGGLGYVPIRFEGVAGISGQQLWMECEGDRRLIDQSVHGHDFWQTDFNPASRRYAITYNVLLDAKKDGEGKVRLVFESKPKP